MEEANRMCGELIGDMGVAPLRSDSPAARAWSSSFAASVESCEKGNRVTQKGK